MAGTGDNRLPSELAGHDHNQGITEHYAPPPPGPPPGHAQSNAEHFTPAPPGHAQADAQHFPPPPGPPPGHAGPPQSTTGNETHPPEYKIPAYDPSHPQFAPPPATEDDSTLYDEPPSHHHQGPGGAGTTTAGATTAASKPGKTSFLDRFSARVSEKVNSLTERSGSEAFLPTTLDKECAKAARILDNFCRKGVEGVPTTEIQPTASTGHASTNPVSTSQNQQTGTAGTTGTASGAVKSKDRSSALLTIPPNVIASATGLAIFTAVRAGLHVSGATGSGVLVARLPDGHWGPPSAISVHVVGIGFVVGMEVYDAVVVINSPETLKAFTATHDRVSLGSDIAVTAGPWGAGYQLDVATPGGDKGKGRDRSRERSEVAPELPPRPRSSEKPLAPDSAAAFQAQPAGVHSGSANQSFAPPPTTAESAGTAGRPGVGGTGNSKERNPSPFRQALRNAKPVFSYVKSRGFYAGVQINGTVFGHRHEANAAFYGAPVSVEQILRGEVPARGAEGHWPTAAKGLFDALTYAQSGRQQAAGQYQQTTTGQYHQQQNLGVPGGVHGGDAGAGTGFVHPGGAQGAAAGAGMAGTTAAMGHASLDDTGGRPHDTAARTNAQEATAEASGAHAAPPPPTYSEHAPQREEDLPAYVDDGRARPGVGDGKAEYH